MSFPLRFGILFEWFSFDLINAFDSEHLIRSTMGRHSALANVFESWFGHIDLKKIGKNWWLPIRCFVSLHSNRFEHDIYMSPPDGRIAIVEEIVGFSIIKNECATSHAQQMTITFVVLFYPFFLLDGFSESHSMAENVSLSIYTLYRTERNKPCLFFLNETETERERVQSIRLFSTLRLLFSLKKHMCSFTFCRITKFRTHAFLPRVSKSNTY